MLTRKLAIAAFDRGRVVPDRLTTKRHAHYAGYAEKMLAAYRTGTGRTRQDLHRSVRGVFADEPDCPYRRIDAFCKLLDDVSVYDTDRRSRAAELRREVFRRAAAEHPLVLIPDRLYEHAEGRVKSAIAKELGRPWAEIDAGLFADVMEFHQLRSFEGYLDGRALLSRYNVAQAQAALFDAREMIVWATEDLKTILRYAKLARLMHTIRRMGQRCHPEPSPPPSGGLGEGSPALPREEAPLRVRAGDPSPRASREAQDDMRDPRTVRIRCPPTGFVIRFDGPASVLRRTRRYGAAMAKFLPSLLACRGWRMRATIETRRPGWLAALDLSPADGLHSHLPPPGEFDSSIEEAFADRWGDAPREGWTLVREGAILHRGQKVFVPDFVFRRDGGREVYLEIVGYWTPEYLEEKAKTLRLFADPPILLAIPESLGEAARPLSDPTRTVWFKSSLKIEPVLGLLRQRLSE